MIGIGNSGLMNSPATVVRARSRNKKIVSGGSKQEACSVGAETNHFVLCRLSFMWELTGKTKYRTHIQSYRSNFAFDMKSCSQCRKPQVWARLLESGNAGLALNKLQATHIGFHHVIVLCQSRCKNACSELHSNIDSDIANQIRLTLGELSVQWYMVGNMIRQVWSSCKICKAANLASATAVNRKCSIRAASMKHPKN